MGEARVEKLPGSGELPNPVIPNPFQLEFFNSFTKTKTDQPAEKDKASAPKAAGKDYEAKEEERVERYLEQWDRLTDMSRAALAWSKLPDKVDLASSQNGRSIELSSDNFAKFFEAVPGLKLDKSVRDLLEGMKGISLKDNQLKIEGKIQTKTSDNLPLTLDNVTLDVLPDEKNIDRIQLRNIKGMECAGFKITEADLLVKRDSPDGLLHLEVSVKNPVPKYLRVLGVPEEDVIKLHDIPLSQAKTVDPVLTELQRKPGERDYVRMAEAITEGDLPKDLHDLIGSVTGRSKRGDQLVLSRSQATTHDLGGLTASFAEKIEAKVTINDKEAKLEKISGIDFKVPLPAEVKKLLGMGEIESKLTEMSLSALDKDGNRVMKLKFDSSSLLESMEIKVGKDLHPVLDKTGKMTVDLVAAKTVEADGKKETVRLPISVSFDPKQMENPPKEGPDFTIKLTGKDEDYMRVAETILQGANLGDVKDLFQAVKSISKKGDSVVIERADKTSRDMGGFSLDADKTISFRVQQNKNSTRIGEIQGLSLTLKPDMPDSVKKYLGLDIGHIPVGIKNVTIVDEGGGKQRVVMEGNNLLSKVGVQLKDGQPMLEADGRWKLYALVQCPPTEEERRLKKPLREMGVILPFNNKNEIDLKSEESAALIAQVAFQNIDPDNPRTWGLGLIAIGSQVTSKAIETGKELKGRFDDGWRQIGDGTAKERFKDGLRQIGDGRAVERFQNGAQQLPGRFESGLKRIGGWLGLD